MSKYMFLPLVIFIISTMLTWAMVRHVEMAQRQRATATAHPRSRPYGTSLPDL